MNPLNSPGTRTLTVSLSLVVVGLGLALATFAVAATDPATQYSGRATGVSIHTPFLNTAFADTGDLPSQGGFQDATFVQLDEPLAKADVLLADTMGFDNVAQSDAATATVRLLPGGPNEVAADFVRSQSTATCNAAVGQSEIVNLVVAGTVVDVSTAPNQVVTVPGVLTLVINEQIDGSHDGTFDMTVNALHLTLATGEEVIVSHAHSDIRCGGVSPVPKDFVTGGGSISVQGGSANFGFVAGYKPGKTVPSCHLTYLDHVAGIKIQMTDLSEYRGEGTTRTFKGPATVNGASDTATITVTDGGEPGRGVDTFQISLDSGYEADGTLAGGNIQLHT